MVQVRGYLPSDGNAAPAEADFSHQQSIIADLTQRKQELMYELTSYQNSKSTTVRALKILLYSKVV